MRTAGSGASSWSSVLCRIVVVGWCTQPSDNKNTTCSQTHGGVTPARRRLSVHCPRSSTVVCSSGVSRTFAISLDAIQYCILGVLFSKRRRRTRFIVYRTLTNVDFTSAGYIYGALRTIL